MILVDFFLVYLYRDFVVKVPRKERKKNPFIDKNNLINMAECQNELSKHMNSIAPCFIDEGKVYTKRAQGVRGDKLKSQDKKMAKILLKKELGMIDKLGYYFDEKLHMKNIFYHEENIYIIDFHRLHKKECLIL